MVTYLDYAATTPMRKSAVDAMRPFFTERFANPSGSHRFARDARRAVDEARDEIAAVIGVTPGEVVFTSGGTEADNTAVRHGGTDDGGALCSAAEHHAVLHAVAAQDGVIVGTDEAGHIDLAALESALATTTTTTAGMPQRRVGIVSVMAVNNEVGTITDLAAVAKLVRRHAPDAVLHTDAVQAASWLDLRTISPLVDMMSLSAHKFGGPKGVGVLTVRPSIKLHPLIVGGGQERERRSGTHNVAGIVATAAALTETDADRAADLVRIRHLRDRLVDGLTANFDGVTETVDRQRKVEGSAHVCIEGVESEALLFLLDEADVCASAASACASGAMQASHVLAAMGVSQQQAAGALRLTLGHTTTDADIDRTLDVLGTAIARLRRTPVGSTR